MFKGIIRYIKKFNREKYLVLNLNKELTKLKDSVNNKRQLILKSKHILLLIKQLEKTNIYWFVKDDIKNIKNYIYKIRKNPKNKSLVYFLTGVYIISPGTFEITGIILFFRYMWKYFIK